MAPSSTIQTTIVPISKPEQYFTWEINARNDLRANSVEWTITEPVAASPTVESLKVRNADLGLTGAEAKIKASDIITAVKDHKQDMNKALSYLFNAVDPNHRSFIAAISDPTPLIYWAKIAERFKKNTPVLLIDSIFRLIDRPATLTDVESYIKAVESLHNQLQTENAGPKLTVDVLCQGILLSKMHKIPHLNYFVARQRGEWTFDNTNLTETGTLLLDFVKATADTLVPEQESTALVVDRPGGPKRARSNTANTSKPGYTGVTCTNQKCIDDGLIKHDPSKCYYNHPEDAFKRWIDKHMPGHPYGKTLKEAREHQ